MPKPEPKIYGPTRAEVIEQLAKIAAKLAGQNPDCERIDRLGDEVVYRGPAWQHPTFMANAEAAFDMLRGVKR